MIRRVRIGKRVASICDDATIGPDSADRSWRHTPPACEPRSGRSPSLQSRGGCWEELAMDNPMINALLIPYGILLVVSIVLLLDWYGRRKERRSKQRP